MAGITRRRNPHMQLGQKGKGKGQPHRGPGGQGGRSTVRRPGPFPTNSPSFMPFPQNPPQAPNFLPRTPGFERAETDINNARLGAATQYNTGKNLLEAQYGLQGARLDTDQGIAKRRELEDQADRGVFTSGFGQDRTGPGTLMQEHVYTPFGRQRQDLADWRAMSEADLASQYGGTLGDLNSQYMDSYLDSADFAYDAQPLGLPVGGYQLPNMPGFNQIYGSAGRTRPRNRNQRQSNNKRPNKKPSGRR